MPLFLYSFSPPHAFYILPTLLRLALQIERRRNELCLFFMPTYYPPTIPPLPTCLSNAYLPSTERFSATWFLSTKLLHLILMFSFFTLFCVSLSMSILNNSLKDEHWWTPILCPCVRGWDYLLEAYWTGPLAVEPLGYLVFICPACEGVRDQCPGPCTR